MTAINYWAMSNADLAAAWRDVDAANRSDNYSGSDQDAVENLNFAEDAILQRMGAPEHASGDEPYWQDRIRQFGKEPDA